MQHSRPWPLLAQAGNARKLGAPAGARGQKTATRLATPETYLGTKRAEGFVPGPPRNGRHTYRSIARPRLNEFSYGGNWNIAEESATARHGATLTANVQAQKVFLVLGSAGRRPRRLRVLLDGHPIRASQAGADVRDATVTVRRQRLYNLTSFGKHRLSLRFDAGISGFAFTFG